MKPAADEPTSQPRKRLAIIGGGSSGLVCLKYALEKLRDWDVHCFEQSGSITGVWGNPYPQFVSTSTKYTTQFACFPAFDAGVNPDGGASRSEFFRDGEYGQYLERFAEHFGLKDHIELHCRVERLCRAEDRCGWKLTANNSQTRNSSPREEHFDAVIICTGLAANAKQIDCQRPKLSLKELTNPAGLGHITGRKVVVLGGGESAVDFANRLAREELENEVYLSLRSGIRVSPRYHPIRGVPSDFLRNRLMLSIHPDLRNWIGQRFVEARIRYRERFERLFPRSNSAQTSSNGQASSSTAASSERRKHWDYKLTRAAKDDLFNVFHNKSDDFLDAVADGRITIIGEAVDRAFDQFHTFDHDGVLEIAPDLVAPAIGYRANFEPLTDGAIHLSDFYLGCCHVEHPDLYLVGFARPIIGNIPSISEMQARLVCGLLAEEVSRPADIMQRHQADLTQRTRRYHQLDLETIFPVEMFPYCDNLARMMGEHPDRRAAGSLRRWWRMQLEPATTLHYLQTTADSQPRTTPAYMPALLVCLLLGLKPVDWIYRFVQGK